jgi:hypothetical protein
MRLTFKKPVVIVTDDVKRIPFDTGVIEHLEYPRDLHIHKTKGFIEQLAEKIEALHAQVKSRKFKPFLETFGKFEVFEPSTESVPADRYIAERLEELTRAVRRLERRPIGMGGAYWDSDSPPLPPGTKRVSFMLPSLAVARAIGQEIDPMKGVKTVRIHTDGKLSVYIDTLADPTLEQHIGEIIAKWISRRATS